MNFFLLLLLLVLSSGAAASAQAEDAIASCNQLEDRQRQIRGCTEYIRSGKALGQNLAVAYTNRGIAYASRGDHKRALADFEVSWKTDPSYTQALYARGLAKKRLGDEKAGDADMAQAKKIDPKLGK